MKLPKDTQQRTNAAVQEKTYHYAAKKQTDNT